MPAVDRSSNLAAEFHVASCLLRLGYAVSLTLGNTKEIDLSAHHPYGWTVTIDSKGLKNTTNWPLVPKRRSRSHFYVFVAYRNRFQDLDSTPEVFVVPSLEIDSLLAKWAGNPQQTCVDYRRIKDTAYRNAWTLLAKAQKGQVAHPA